MGHVLTIAWKDLRSELRTKESINAAAAFSMVILVLFSFVLDIAGDSREFAGGLLWLVFAFAGALVLNRSFAREQPNDCLDALVASPLPGWALFLGKAIANFALLAIVEAVALPVFGILFNSNWLRFPGWIALTCALATWGMTVIGTMFSALTVNLRLRELMLPVLVYPMLIPVLMAAMKLTTSMLTGEGVTADDWVWVKLLIGFDIIFTSLSLALIDVILVS
jgi:heme exporter protein B